MSDLTDLTPLQALNQTWRLAVAKGDPATMIQCINQRRLLARIPQTPTTEPNHQPVIDYISDRPRTKTDISQALTISAAKLPPILNILRDQALIHTHSRGSRGGHPLWCSNPDCL